MTDKAKASEHDLRERSKPEVKTVDRELYRAALDGWNKDQDRLAAILEENQNLRGMYEEQMRLKDEYKELMRKAEAENQRLAKELARVEGFLSTERSNHETSILGWEAAEAKLGKMREALQVIGIALKEPAGGEYWSARKFLDKRNIYNDDLDGDRVLLRVAEAALAE